MTQAFQKVTKDEYIKLFGTGSDDETLYENWSDVGLESTEETPEAQSVGEKSVEGDKPYVSV